VDAPYKSFVNNLNLLTLSPDGKYVIYEINSKLHIYNIESKKSVPGPDKPIKLKGCCGGVVIFSPEGKSIYITAI